MPRPKRPTLSLTQMLTEDQKIAHRRDMFHDWMQECEAMHYALVEGMLANLPSLKDG